MLTTCRNDNFLHAPGSVQSSSVASDSLRPHSRPPCSSPTPGVYPNSSPLSRWCHPTISSSVVPFSSCPQSFPASGSFQMSQGFVSGGQSIGVSASASVLPMNTQDWSPLGWTDWISLQFKGLSRVFSNTTVQKHQFFSTQLSLQLNSHIHTWPLENPYPWLEALVQGTAHDSPRPLPTGVFPISRWMAPFPWCQHGLSASPLAFSPDPRLLLFWLNEQT